MFRIRKKLGLTVTFSLSILIINIITAVIAAFLMYIFYTLGIINHKDAIFMNKMAIPTVTILSCIIIGTIVSAFLSKKILKNIVKFIDAIEKVSRGDFTARLELESPLEFKYLSKNFNLMVEELQGIEVLRTDFINNFSHEFKTPIISIKGFAEILKDGDITQDERNEYLDIIIAEANRLSSLSTNVLNLSKIENQVILQDTQYFNIAEQIRESILLLVPKVEDKNITLDINVEDCIINGNKEMLNQVWVNLFDNAIKFNKKNGIISIKLIENNNNIYITVLDSGSGIKKEAIPKIFDKFYQEDISHSTNGNGLGLAIVKKIIYLHGGKITCNSMKGRGTKFNIILPMDLKENKKDT